MAKTAVIVNVKWNKDKFDVELDPKDSPLTFKAQMFALTGVHPDRQKIMFKGKILNDNAWDNFPLDQLQQGSQLLMMGSAEVVPEKPKEKTMFLEDMNDAQLTKALEIPVGLKNLGMYYVTSRNGADPEYCNIRFWIRV